MKPSITEKKIAILLPCHNEEITIASVVKKFRKHLPKAEIYVYDNNSTDQTVAVAKKAGAVVVQEKNQGKGYVVRRMFAEVDADIYLMADGDDTYDVPSASKLIDHLVSNNLDMVVGRRIQAAKDSYPAGHRFGNALFNFILRLVFKSTFQDIFSGYRVFSRRFVKSFPALSGGFDIETELSVHSLEMHLPVDEIPTPYYERPEGSFSKLSTFKDGFKVSLRIVRLFKEVNPLLFFGLIGLGFALLAGILALPIVLNFMKTGLVPRLPTVIGITGLILLACLSLVSGIILDSVSVGRKKMKRLFYLNVK